MNATEETEETPNRLVASYGENTFEEILKRPRDEHFMAVVKMGYHDPIQRVHVFESPKGGLHVVWRTERLLPFGKGVKISRKVNQKLFLQPDDVLSKHSSGVQRCTLEHTASRRQEKMLQPHIDKMYPFLKDLIAEPEMRGELMRISMHKVLKHKLFTAKEVAQQVYPNLWWSVVKLVMTNPVLARRSTPGYLLKKLNKIAKHNPEVNPFMMGLDLGADGADVFRDYERCYELFQAYGEAFTFRWSEGIVREELEKAEARYAHSLRMQDTSPININGMFLLDWAQFNSDDVNFRLVRTYGEVAALEHLDEYLATNVTNGSNAVLEITDPAGVHYVRLDRKWVAVNPGDPFGDTNLMMRASKTLGSLPAGTQQLLDESLELINQIFDLKKASSIMSESHDIPF